MKTKSRSNFKNQGFTLLEVVITLIVGSILGAILVQFMGTSMKNSFEPVIMVQNGYGGHEIMEKLNSVYKMRLMTSTGDPLDDFRTDVINGRLPLIAPVIGHYTATTNYIVFDNNGDEVSDNTQLRILKVTITHGGQSLTALFTR
jgi:prepilin-type N-terminal cleavage/methylation domain-containing protein